MATQGHLRFVLALLGWMGMGCQELIAETDESILAKPKMHTKSLLILSTI
jgi:hypothetical protein